MPYIENVGGNVAWTVYDLLNMKRYSEDKLFSRAT